MMNIAIPFKPMLCTPQREGVLDAFDDEWTVEVKYDGERILAQRVAGQIYLWTRRERNVAYQFPEIVDALKQCLPREDWVVDGEITVAGGFEKLLRRNVGNRYAIIAMARTNPAQYHIFDLLKVGDFLFVNNATLAERRNVLSSMVATNGYVGLAICDRGTRARYLFNLIRGDDGEGIVVKRLDSKYVPGLRSPDWFKIKKVETVDVQVVGCTESEALPFGSLVLIKDGKYFGKVGTGFTHKQRADILDRLRRHPDMNDFARWDVPSEVKREMSCVCGPLVAEIKMLEASSTGKPRHPVWVRWRE